MKKSDIVATLRHDFNLAKQERIIAKTDPQLNQAKIALKSFQNQRLRQTHADFLAHPNTSAAANFFLREIYGTKDVSQRDKDLDRLMPMMEKTFPAPALEIISKAMKLDALTEQLDNVMARSLGAQFSLEQYMQVFATKTTKQQRLEQLLLVRKVADTLIAFINIPFLSATLKIMRGPAKLANLLELHEFLEQGFTIFKNMKNPEKFIHELLVREEKLLYEIFDGTTNNKPAKEAASI